MQTSSSPVILVIRYSSLGDCLLLGPVLRGLRNRFPDHRIVWLTRPPFKPIWQGSPLLDSIIEWNREEPPPVSTIQSLGTIEYLLDLQASPRSRLLVKSLNAPHVAESAPPRWKRTLQILTKRDWLIDEPPVPLRYLRSAAEWGVQDDGRGLELPIDTTALDLIKTKWGDKKRIGLAPGAKHPTKCWHWDNYVTLAHKLIESGFGILWMIGPVESELVSEIERNGLAAGNLITYPDWTIPQIVAAVSLCSAVVSNDSAAMHIAAGTDRPGVALFGPTIPEFGFAPFRSHLEVMGRDLWCRPCSAHGGKKCPLKHHRCMTQLTVNMVWKKLHSEHIVE